MVYVESFSDELDEWLLAMFVDETLALLLIKTMARGGVSSVAVDFRQLIGCGPRIGTAGFLLVHNHPSGDPRPSAADVQTTNRLRLLSTELEMPLLDHLIVARGEVRAIGWEAG